MMPGQACFWSWAEGAGRHSCGISRSCVPHWWGGGAHSSNSFNTDHTLVGQVESPCHVSSTCPLWRIRRAHFPSALYGSVVFFLASIGQQLHMGRELGIPAVHFRNMWGFITTKRGAWIEGISKWALTRQAYKVSQLASATVTKGPWVEEVKWQ